MVYHTFTYLIISAFTCLANPSWGHVSLIEAADLLEHMAGPDIAKVEKAAGPGNLFAYQLKEDHESGLTLLLHLKSPVDILEIFIYSPIGQSRRVIHKNALERGFYYLPLTQTAKKQPLYWEVRIDNSKALSFIR